MPDQDPERWRELAKRASTEKDSEKLRKLTEQIDAILAENEARKKEQSSSAA